MSRKWISLAAVLAALALAWAGPGAAQVDAAPAPGPALAGDLDDPKEVEGFVDGVVNTQLALHHITGATVAVVKDGQPILVKGYGYADVDSFKPVDGQTTLFRPGSVSKLVTWTAVMQLVEQGKIDLNADVNTYIGWTVVPEVGKPVRAFHIPEAFGQPITVLNLMTHTPGFEDTSRDLFVEKPEKLDPLEGYLSSHVPARIYPPGKVSAYSNYGATLAGYIVQEVSGMPFEEYVEQNIFTPLDMDHSTFRQPLPESIKGDMSKGYFYNGGVYTLGEFEYVNAFPAGALSAPAADMAKFMIAHLQDGEYNGARILKAETAQEMHAPAWTPSPDIEGMAHGFYSTIINGQRIIQHGGDTALFHSELMLIPGQNAGLFVSYNAFTAGSAGAELRDAFMDHYFPVERKPQKAPADFKTRLSSYTGNYGLARLNVSSPEKVTGLFQSVAVSPGPDDTLLVTSIRSPGALDRYVEVKPGVLKMIDGSETMVFLDEANGQYQTAYLASVPMVGALRSPWYATPTFGIVLLSVCLALFLTGIFAAPVGLFGLRVKPPDPDPNRGRRLLARWVAFGFCLLAVLGVVALGVMVGALMTNPGIDWAPLDAILWLPRLSVVLALAMVGLAYFAWREKYWSLAGRIHYSLLTVAALAYIGFELMWRLMG